MARQSLLSVLLDLNADGFEKGLQKAQRSMRRTAGSLQRSGAKLTRNVTAPLALIGATSFKVAADFGQSMAKVKAVSGATAGEFKRLKENALELGRSTRFSASQVAQLQLEFSKLGFTADEINKVTGATLNLAQATGSDLAQSAEVAGSTLRAFGLNASETQRVTDVMAASFSSSALDMDSFQDSMKFVAPVARKAGLSIEQTTAMLAALANNGIKGSTAGTSLRRILSTLGSTGGDVEEALAGLTKESLTLGGAQDEVGRNAQSSLLVLLDSMGVIGELSTAFDHAEGAASGMAATMDDTAEGAVKRMQSAVEGMQISIGSALAPTVLDIIKRIENLAAGFSSLSKTTQGFIVKVGLAAAAIGPFKSSLGALLGRISRSNKATKLLSKSLTLLKNPYTILIAAAAALTYNLLKQIGVLDRTANVQKRINKVSKTARKGYVEEAAKVSKLAEEYRLFKGDLDKRKRILEDLKAIHPGYFGDLDAEKTKYQDLKSAVSDYSAELRAQAIEKAFGEELLEIETEQLKKKEELRDAELALASATEFASRARGSLAKEGFDQEAIAATQVQNATNEVNRLTREQTNLQKAKEAVLAKIKRAEEELAALRSGGSSGGNTEDPVTPTASAIVVPVNFEVDSDATSKILDQLSKDLNDVASQMTLDGDTFEHIDDLAAAYEKAALAAIKLGDVELAEQLRALSAEAMAAMPVGDLLGFLTKQSSDLGEQQQKLIPIAEQVGSAIANSMAGASDSQESFAATVANAAKSVIAARLAEATSTAITNAFQSAKATGPAAAIVGPILAGTAAAGVMALFNKIPSFAQGGMVTSGPTLAMIGDNRSGREAVVPFERMGEFVRSAIGPNLGASAVNVHGRIDGRDLILVQERGMRNQSRYR